VALNAFAFQQMGEFSPQNPVMAQSGSGYVTVGKM
jgi:hypothetical protein